MATRGSSFRRKKTSNTAGKGNDGTESFSGQVDQAKQPSASSRHMIHISKIDKSRSNSRESAGPQSDRSINSELSNMSKYSHGSMNPSLKKDQKARKKSISKKDRPMSLAQQQFVAIQDTFKSLAHLPKQRLHPFDFQPEELEQMKKLFPEFKPIPEHMPQNRSVKSNGIPIIELIAELKNRIKTDERKFLRMIAQLDRKSDTKVTWTEFLNFLTNEGTRRETVNDAQLYGYGVKRLKQEGRHHLRVVDQYHGGPEKIAEYYIDGMVFIKLKNIKLLLNLFENKEAKLYDLRSLQPIQTLVFQSDYSIPKPKKTDNRLRKSLDPYGTESMSKTNTNAQSHTYLHGEANETASATSFNHMTSGIIHMDTGQDISAMHTLTAEELSQQTSGDIQVIKATRPTNQINKRDVSQKKRAVSTLLERNKKGVNFHPGKEGSERKNSAKSNTKAVVQSYADSEIKTSDVNNKTITIENPQKPQGSLTKLPLSKVKQVNAISSSDHGSVSTIGGRFTRAQTVLNKDDSTSDINDSSNPVLAWKAKNSRHRELVRDKIKAEQAKKEKEEYEQKHCRILGLADLTSKNSARDFLDRANEKTKKQMKLNSAMSKLANHDVDLKRELETNKKEFFKEISKRNKELVKHDKKKEEAFYDAYLQKEIADKLQKETELARAETTNVQHASDTISSNAYRSATVSGSRLGGIRRRPTLHRPESEQRGKSATKDPRRPKSKIGTSMINEDINYYGRYDLVERAITATGYIPLALRDDKSVIQLSNNYIKELKKEDQKCELALKETQKKKNNAMKEVLRYKEANRFFFTQNPLQPPFYYPDTVTQADIEHMIGSTQESSFFEDESGTSGKKEITPRTQAKIDYQMLFGDNSAPQPCEPGLIKKALEERRKKMMQEDGLKEDPMFARRELMKKQNQDRHQMRRIKQTKEIYTVAADFCQSQDGEKSLVALALIDQQILVYQLKQSGVKISLVELFSFYAKFPGKAAVSALCLDHYVTDRRPIICIGSQNGDVAIYYLDHMTKDKKVCQKLIIQFNFFERGVNKDNSDSGEEEDDDNESEFENQKSFVIKMGGNSSAEIMKSPSDNKRSKARHPYISDVDLRSESSITDSKAGNADGLRLTSQQFSNAIMDAPKNVQDDFWEVLMNTRKPKEGPDGITLWNRIFKKIKDQESAIILCKCLMDMKLDSLDAIDEIIERWQLCIRMNGGLPTEALGDFARQMENIRQEKARIALLKNKNKTRRGAEKDAANSAQANRRMSKDLDSKKKQRQKTDSKKRKNTIIDPILEDMFENVSTFGEEPLNSEFNITATKPDMDHRQGADGKASKPNISSQKKIKNPITKLRYIKDIGLIVTSFNGTIKFFDAFNFFQIWKNDNKARAENQHTSITCFDVSSPLGIMVTGGAEGLLLSIDPHALGVTNQADAHKGKDILSVFIFDEQQQIISVCEDRSVCLWDAFRLDKLQTIKDHMADNHIPKFTAASFDKHDGSLYVGDQLLQVWKSSVDPIVEINALQIQTLSTAMIKERNLTQLVELSSNFNSVKQSSDERSGSVLISSLSSLVEILIDDQTPLYNYVVTVDTENLVRIWNIKEHTTNITFKLPMQKRVTAVDINKLCTYVAVGNQIGEAFVVNSKSGGIIYKLPGADDEVSAIKFLTGQSEFWIVAALWHGKVVFWSQPNEQNNYTINAKVRIGHRGDINELACQSNYIISGGQDGLLGVWNQFSGVLKYAIKLPKPLDSSLPSAKGKLEENTRSALDENMGVAGINPKASHHIRRTIVGLMFHPYWKNVALVLQEGGNIHAVDVSNGMIVNDYLAMVQMNSSWAIDPFNFVMMVVGDQGKAVLFDAKMGANQKLKVQKHKDIFDQASFKEKKQVHTKRVPVYTPSKEKWPVLRNWFTAHTFSKTEPLFVNNVKFSKSASLFVTSTNFGEVKFWDSHNCHPMGCLNSLSFNPTNVISYIKKMRKTTIACSEATEEVYKALKKQNAKVKEMMGLGPNNLLQIPSFKIK